MEQKGTLKVINADILIFLNGIGVSELSSNLDFDGASLYFFRNVAKTEGIDWENG